MQVTHISSNSFSVPGNYVNDFSTGRRIQANCGTDGLVFVTVASSSFGSGITTVTIKESTLTANLMSVLFGAGAGASHSLPDHVHDGSAGEGGLPLRGIFWRGTWGSGTTYAINDAVSRNGSSYISMENANTGNDPATDGTNWNLLTQKGDTGPTGPPSTAFTPLGLANGAYQAHTATLTIDSGMSPVLGSLLVAASDSELDLAKADVAGHMPAMYMATGTGTGAQTVIRMGFVRNDSWSWTPGGLLYVDPATAGALTQTKPSTTGQQVQVVGVALTSHIIDFFPQLTIIQV